MLSQYCYHSVYLFKKTSLPAVWKIDRRGKRGSRETIQEPFLYGEMMVALCTNVVGGEMD